MARYEESSFYCLNCGERGLDCLRKTGKKKVRGIEKMDKLGK